MLSWMSCILVSLCSSLSFLSSVCRHAIHLHPSLSHFATLCVSLDYLAMSSGSSFSNHKQPLLLFIHRHVFEMFSKLDASNLQVPLKWVLEQALKKRHLAINSDALQYRLEAVKEPGIALDLDLPLGEVDVRDFKIMRVGVSSSHNFDEIERGSNHRGRDSRQQHYSDRNSPTTIRSHYHVDREQSLPDMFSIEAPLYKEFRVKAMHKLSKGIDVSLAVSGQKIDMNPFPGRTSHKPWSWHPKAVSIPIEDIADCVVVKASEFDTWLVCHTRIIFPVI